MAKRTHTADGSDGTNHKTAENVAAKELRQFLERVERLEEEKKTISDDIKDVKGEAKGRGYDMKAFNQILKERKQDRDERMEFEAILDTYRAALGMLPDGTSDDEGDPV